MSAFQTFRVVLVGALKLAILAVGVYATCAVTLSIQRASSPTSKDMCDRVKVGMTVNQIDDATRGFEGWQLLRPDGVLVISTGPHRDSPVCRVAIAPQTHRAVSKSMGPLQQVIGLRYEKALGETFRLASARVGDDYCPVATADYSSSWVWNAFICVSLSRGSYRYDLAGMAAIAAPTRGSVGL
jgi:hypothetical protein